MARLEGRAGYALPRRANFAVDASQRRDVRYAPVFGW